MKIPKPQTTNHKLDFLIIPVFEKALAGEPLDPVMQPALQGKILLADIARELPVLLADQVLHDGRMGAGEFLQRIDSRIIKSRQPLRGFPGQGIVIVKFFEFQVFL